MVALTFPDGGCWLNSVMSLCVLQSEKERM